MIIIDGHNLLHCIQKTAEGYESISDVQLCHIIGRYLKLTGEKGKIIFDGIGPPDKSRLCGIRNLDVFFAGLATDADTVIEDKIRASTAPRRLVIVSSDQRLQKAARTGKATPVKCEVFWAKLQKKLRHKRKIKEPAAKRHGLSDAETEQWLEFFGLEQ